MAEVLVLVELNPAGGGVRKTTLEALTAARALGEPSAGVKVNDEGDGAEKLVGFLAEQKIV